jgi:hypothetical protein
LDPYWLGLLIPNLAFAVGLALFGRVALLVTGSAATTWRACVLLAAFPSSFYFSAPYQESLFFALSAAALLAWLERRPARSAAALAAASTARLTALSMSLGLVLEWAIDILKGRAARRGAWLVAIAGTLGTALFFGYLALRFHDPLLHLKAHAAWLRKSPTAAQLLAAIWSLVRLSAVMVRRSVVFTLSLVLLAAWLYHRPLISAYRRFAAPQLRLQTAGSAQENPRPFLLARPAWTVGCGAILVGGIGLMLARAAGWTGDVVSTLHMVAYSRDLLATILFLGLGIHAFVKRGPLWGCLVLVPVLQALASGSILSMTRVVLSAYPAFVDAAEIASNRAVFAITVIVCLLAQFVLLTSYVNWVFVA